MFPSVPSLVLVLVQVLVLVLASPALLTPSASQLQVRGQRAPRDTRQDSIKVVISEGCVTQGESSDVSRGGKEIDLTPGSPLILTHKIKLVPSGSGSGSCGCEADFAALRERLERLEREVSSLREKCGGAEGGCCTSKESKGAGCSIKPEMGECPNECSDQGRCVDGKCVCFPGFSGPDCSQSNCPGNCNDRGRNRGKCVNGKCVCDVGFAGPDCGAKGCPGNCNNKGRCVKGRCVCRRGFTGADCSQCEDGMTGPNCDTAMSGVSQLSTRDITESSVTLLWTPPGVQYDTYHITFTSQKESDQQISVQVEGSLTTFTQTGLAAGQDYTVSITGEIGGKRGAETSAEFMTLISGPTNLRVVKTTSTSAVVQWEQSQGEIDRYRLTVTPNDGAGKSQEMMVPAGQDSAHIQQLVAGRLYDITLVAEKGTSRSKPATTQATPGKTLPRDGTMAALTMQVTLAPGHNVGDGDQEFKPSLEVQVFDQQRRREDGSKADSVKVGDSDGPNRDSTASVTARTKPLVSRKMAMNGTKPKVAERPTLYRKPNGPFRFNTTRVVPGWRNVGQGSLRKPPVGQKKKEQMLPEKPKPGVPTIEDRTIALHVRDPSVDASSTKRRDDKNPAIMSGTQSSSEEPSVAVDSKKQPDVGMAGQENATAPVSPEPTETVQSQEKKCMNKVKVTHRLPHQGRGSGCKGDGTVLVRKTAGSDQGSSETDDSKPLSPETDLDYTPARSFQFENLPPQTEYTVTLLGKGPGLLSRLHKLVISTGPEPPTDIAFSAVTENSLTVSWTKPKTPISGFKVTYTHTDDGEPVSVTVDSGDSTVGLSQLSPGSSYEVSVISILGLDESDPIKDFVMTLPDPPTDLRAVNVTDTKALLLWRPALAAVDKYAIVYGAGTDSELRITVSGNAAEQQLSGLDGSTTYTVTISSQLGSAESSVASTSFTTSGGSGTGGDGPSDLQANDVTPRTALLSWKPPLNPAGSYRLTYQTDGQGLKEVIVDASVTEYNLTRLQPGSKYTVQLQAEEGGGYTAAISTDFTTGTLRFPFPSDCSQELLNGIRTSGEVEIFPQGKLGTPMMVYCDMETDGGGWTVFQRRKDGSVDFFRGWKDYTKGFGSLSGEFWLGLERLYNLTAMTRMSLRVDLRDKGEAVFAKYSTFELLKRNYKLNVGGYSGTAGDSLSYHNQRVFSTKDRDPAPFITRCAMSYRGGWWYKNCHEANLNGVYGINVHHQGVIWTSWKGKEVSIPFTEMKLRPAAFRPPTSG
ncbi:hypothetical protein EPR50_G00144440 [Perca flavescens]|uniref:Tenascin n=1 Tax=Perca flavescens TaxID=8167 RepID=A0A484CIT8_PERFV|nr:hypothetical protein EPR50_G00144440 [Perca flavescens]